MTRVKGKTSYQYTNCFTFIVTTPFLFEAIFDLQHIILSENTVGKIILRLVVVSLNVGAQATGRIMSFDISCLLQTRLNDN